MRCVSIQALARLENYSDSRFATRDRCCDFHNHSPVAVVHHVIQVVPELVRQNWKLYPTALHTV